MHAAGARQSQHRVVWRLLTRTTHTHGTLAHTCKVQAAHEAIIKEYSTMAAEVGRPAGSGEEALARKRYIGR